MQPSIMKCPWTSSLYKSKPGWQTLFDMAYSLRNTASLQPSRFSHSHSGGTPWWVSLCQTSTCVGQTTAHTHVFSQGRGSSSATPCKRTYLSMNLPDSFQRWLFCKTVAFILFFFPPSFFSVLNKKRNQTKIWVFPENADTLALGWGRKWR